MEVFILIVHVLIAIGIISLILLQQGKGADVGASFGTGASQTLFGSAGGGSALTKATAVLAFLFFATSFGLAIVAKDKANSVGIDIPDPALIEDRADLVIPDAMDLNEADIPQIPASDEFPAMGESAFPDAGEIPAADDSPSSEIPQ